MTESEKPKGHVIDPTHLPAGFPTHRHSPAFWEALGRAVASFGFLEETLARAIFGFTGTRKIPEKDAEAEFEKWLATLKRTLSDSLGPLIDTYGKAVRGHQDANIPNFDTLLADLRKATKLRNVICHGSWRPPDANGFSTTFYVDKKEGVFTSPVDIAYLQQIQTGVAEVTAGVVNSFTYMGWQFPGTSGPGNPVFQSSKG